MTGSWPVQACQSERQTPVAPTRMTAPSSGQSGSGVVTTVGISPYAEYCTARMGASVGGPDGHRLLTGCTGGVLSRTRQHRTHIDHQHQEHLVSEQDTPPSRTGDHHGFGGQPPQGAPDREGRGTGSET